ncbi:MAG: FKBP-type peptidyl-prolyl cis-trans isomerase [Gammaproteobacteria bacterium]
MPRINRRLFTAAACLTLLVSVPAQASDLTAEGMSHEQKMSYLQGYGLGLKLKQSDFELDPEAFALAVRDALGGAESRISDEQANATLQAEKARQLAELEAASKANVDKGKAYMAENKKKDGVEELTSGVQYRVIKAGDGKGKTPKDNDTVSVHYEGTLIDGTVFDSSYQRGEPVEFQVGGVIPGFQEALMAMQEGDKWEVVIPPHLAYGPQGAGGKIGPNETLIFQLELLGVK